MMAINKSNRGIVEAAAAAVPHRRSPRGSSQKLTVTVTEHSDQKRSVGRNDSKESILKSGKHCHYNRRKANAGADLSADIAKSAVNREIRGRSRAQPRSPVGRRKAAVATIKSEMLEKANLMTEKVRQRSSGIGKASLGTDALESIKDHKSIIAEMRPVRRKIKWNSNLSDWERNQQRSTRISGLNLGDLQIHGRVPLSRENSIDSVCSQEPPEPGRQQQQQRKGAGDQIDNLERNIRRCFKTLKRLAKEASKDKQETDALANQNQDLRRAIVAMPMPQQQSMRQSQKQLSKTVELLQTKLAELDEQITMIDLQRQKFDLESEAILKKLNTSKAKHKKHRKKSRKRMESHKKPAPRRDTASLEEASTIEWSDYASSDQGSLSDYADAQQYYGYGDTHHHQEPPSYSRPKVQQQSATGRGDIMFMPGSNGGQMLRRMSATPAAA